MHYFQFQIFISGINIIFGIFVIMLGAGSKVLGAGSICPVNITFKPYSSTVFLLAL